MLIFFCKKGFQRLRGDDERQSNGVTKMMKNILQDKLVPNEYWVEAMNTTIYWLNGHGLIRCQLV